MRSSSGRTGLVVRGLALAALLGVAACNPAATPTPPPAETTPTPPASSPQGGADDVNHTAGVMVLACADPAQQLCSPPVSVTVWTEGRLIVAFNASPGHCSSVIAHLTLDGQDRFTSPPLAAGDGTAPQDFGPVSPGEHVVGIQAEGIVGGCNSGGVANWSGTLDLTLSGAAGVASPRVETPAP